MSHPHPTLRLLLAASAVLLIVATANAQKLRDARTVSKETATQATKEFRRVYRSKDPRIRLAAVDRLTTLKHSMIAKSLAAVLRKDRAIKVRAGAAQRLGLQDPKQAYRPLLGAWQSRDNKQADEVLIAVLEAWRRMGKVPDLKVLTNKWDKRSKEVQREIIKASGVRREMATVKWLGTLIDSPAPMDVDSPTNPPAAYWKAKIIRWRFWAIDVHDVITDLTDQDFESEREVRKWIKGGGKVLVRKKKER